MPAAIDMNQLVVDQSLVDNYLARVKRFADNVKRFEEQLDNALTIVKDRFMPEQKTQSAMDIEHREPEATKPDSAVVTADDIDIDALLSGVDIGGMSI